MHEHWWAEWSRRSKARTMGRKQRWRGARQAGRKTEAKQQWQASPSCTVLCFHNYRNSPERAAQVQRGRSSEHWGMKGHKGDRGTQQPWSTDPDCLCFSYLDWCLGMSISNPEHLLKVKWWKCCWVHKAFFYLKKKKKESKIRIHPILRYSFKDLLSVMQQWMVVL